MKKIILISCAAKKLAQKAKAKDIYISQIFKSSLAYAYRQKPDKIFILSALHGLLSLEKEIEPYDVTLCYVPKNKREPGLRILTAKETRAWGKKVIERLSKQTDLQKDKFIVLAGRKYLKPIINNISHVEEPLQGLRHWERIKFLDKNS